MYNNKKRGSICVTDSRYGISIDDIGGPEGIKSFVFSDSDLKYAEVSAGVNISIAVNKFTASSIGY